MTTTTQEVASLSVAQMYQEGLRLSALAAEAASHLGMGSRIDGIKMDIRTFDEENAHNAAVVSAYATAAQAHFVGVQAAAFATMAIEASSDLADSDQEVDGKVATTVFEGWLKVFTASGGQ